MPVELTPPAAAAERPLVVDLDGTLLNSDMLAESYFALLARRPVAALAALFTLARGRAALKARVAAASVPDLSLLPWNRPFVAFIEAERARGRRIYLASASARAIVEAVAAHFGLFDGIFASDDTVNLKSGAKAAALCRAFGEGGFDYAGNESADLAVWEKSGGVVAVNLEPGLLGRVRARWPETIAFERPSVGPRAFCRAIRVHQWLKNLLVFVPALAAHRFDAATLAICTAAWLSFSLTASAVYVFNDLVDLGRDRVHPTKRRRPFASGTIPVPRGIRMIPALLILGALPSLFLPREFALVLAGYLGLTIWYSLALKSRMMIDVVALACLYGVRLIAGGVAADVAVSAWLAAFSLFLFYGLALVKRCAELARREDGDAADGNGRAYRAGDLPILEALAAAAGFVAILVFALYLNSPTVQVLYAAPQRLWLLCVVMVYWIGRVLILTHRGEMHDDPVVFAATDRVSLFCLGLALAVIAASL